MSGPSAPPPAPNPQKTIEAQTESNKQTAITQQGLNATNQVTPYGKLEYTQGTPWADGTPHYTATQTLSPEQQNLFNLSTKTQGNLGQIGVDQSSKVGQILNTPFDLNSATNTQISDQATKLLDPIWKQRLNDQESTLMNRGLDPQSEAYGNAMRDFSDQRDRSYTSAALAGRGQATQEALTQRNQPLNEIAALLSGSQVSQPNFVNGPNTSVNGTDVAGITQAGYQNSLVPWQSENQYNQALMGGLFGLAGNGMKAFALSDRRVKEDIVQVGVMFDGTPVYSFRYIGEPHTQIGLMAQDVEQYAPEAVVEIQGIKHVHYKAATARAAAMAAF